MKSCDPLSKKRKAHLFYMEESELNLAFFESSTLYCGVIQKYTGSHLNLTEYQ